MERKSRSEAWEWLRTVHWEEAAVMSALYRGRSDEKSARRRESERSVREWMNSLGGDEEGGIVEEGSVASSASSSSSSSSSSTTNVDDERERERDELRMNMETLEMLPRHVVAALKAKYETSNGLRRW